MVPRDASGGAGEALSFRADLLRAAEEAGRPLDDLEADRLTAHFRLLRHWGRRMNLTGLREPRSILRRHFLEPIRVSDLLEGRGILLDIGSGNGFPAVPLAVLHPGTELILVESSERKSSFLWAVFLELGLKAARVVTRRACRRADLADLLPARWITFRGIRSADLFDGPGPGLLEPGGRLLAFMNVRDAEIMRDRPPDGVIPLGTRALPSSPGDVVALFGPRD